MIIRLVTGEDEVRTCAVLDHSYSTDHVWQMDARERAEDVNVSFRRVRLPRTMQVQYPRCLDELVFRWKQGDAILVAEDEGRIVGYLDLAIQDDQDAGWARNLAIAPRFRRRGIGTTLLQAAADWLRRRKVNQLLIEMTTKNNPAICLAKKLGFSFCGYNDRYYANHDIAIFFVKSLR